MATYISLVNFTDQGIRNIKESPDRFAAFKNMAEKMGVSVKGFYYAGGGGGGHRGIAKGGLSR